MARVEVVEARKKKGGAQISASLDADEHARFTKHAKRLGGTKATILAGLDALEAVAQRRNEITKQDVIDAIERRMK